MLLFCVCLVVVATTSFSWENFINEDAVFALAGVVMLLKDVS